MGKGRWRDLAVRALVGLALIALLVSLDLAAVARLLASADPALLALVAALTFAYTFGLSERWRLILRVLGVPVGARRAFDLTMRGFFFGTWLPGYVGGDAAKAYILGRGGRMPAAFASVVLDRFSGMAALLWLGAAAGWTLSAESRPLSALLAAGAAALTAVGLGGPALLALLERPLLAVAPRFARAAVVATAETARRAGARPALFVGAMLLSVPLHLFYVAQVYLLARALGAGMEPARAVWAVTWATAAGALPLSLGGLGPREAAFAATLASAELGVAVGLLAGLMQLLSGVPGGVAQLLEGAAPYPEPAKRKTGESVTSSETASPAT